MLELLRTVLVDPECAWVETGPVEVPVFAVPNAGAPLSESALAAARAGAGGRQDGNGGARFGLDEYVSPELDGDEEQPEDEDEDAEAAYLDTSEEEHP